MVAMVKELQVVRLQRTTRPLSHLLQELRLAPKSLRRHPPLLPRLCPRDAIALYGMGGGSFVAGDEVLRTGLA